MEGLDEDAVDFRATYDNEDREPVVFPGPFPNLLANGASGIAVGMATNIPPHNVAEICDALQLLIEARMGRRGAVTMAEIMERMPGPDFPTGGVIVDTPDTLAEAYETGRGSIRLRARWEKESTGRGTWQIVVTEIPYQVNKARLIERLAALVNERKVPLLADVRDESAADLRIVLEPKSRNVDPELLMETLFRLTDLEIRYALNLNVIDLDGTPRVLSLKGALEAFLDHQRTVLQRRTAHRLKQIDDRVEVLEGYLVTYLNLDEVIRIIRSEDEPKPVLMARFELTERQADAILNMRLKSLRKLEEMEIRAELDRLLAERAELERLKESPRRQWAALGARFAEVKEMFAPDTALGARRTRFGEAPEAPAQPLEEALVEREPITVVCSERGWVRAIKGHLPPEQELSFKEGDRERFRFHAHTTDRLLAFTSSGRMHTIPASRLPGGRGHGEPLKLMVDLDGDEEVVALLAHRPAGKLLLASTDGRGFIVAEEDVLAQTRTGRQVMRPAAGARALAAVPVEGDHVAVVGTNRKLLIFPVAEVPELARGRGVILQRYRSGRLSDVAVFRREEGLSWRMGGESGRRRNLTEIEPWLGRRGAAGRLAPSGFPRDNRFG
ncbi:MAG: DNA topoisomerase 4 subunit A [Rhodothalassiaceae bacterium]|nr:MAG: DNA topoisomerase 4 subunit A [Rhodothalassiaceae bacterium]